MAEKKTMLVAKLQKPLSQSVAKSTKEELQEKITLEEIPIPTPGKDEVLVRVEKSAINPSDLSILSGTYGRQTSYPSFLGNEGCGTVVSSGEGAYASSLVGKRIAFSLSSAWSQYVVLPATKCVDIGPTPWEYATSVFVNPMTVYGFVEIAQLGGHTSILHTAAASALGKMLIRYGKRNNIKVICIVRKEEQEKVCRDEGAEYVLNSNAEGFYQKLKQVCEETKCTLAFDAVGGSLTGTILSAMLEGARVEVYGALSEQACGGIDPRDLIFKKKSVKGFWLTEYLKGRDMNGMIKIFSTIVPLLTSDFKTETTQTFPLSQLHEALQSYTKDMNAKVALQINESK